jgi:hypothetical protein
VRKVQTVAVIVGLFFSFTASAQTKPTPGGMNKIEPLPRDLEIQLALSALPTHLRDTATVYVLNPDKGFEVARKGTNGFHALVARTGDDTFRGSWPFTKYRDDILYPISFDEAGTKAQMRVFFDAAEMQAKGTPPEELKKIIQDRYKAGYYKAPERAGVSYMLSPILRTYGNPDQNDSVGGKGNDSICSAARVTGKGPRSISWIKEGLTTIRSELFVSRLIGPLT